ncbi:hypothetical protein [Herbaspirillum sp. NPDC087042]|uniref:hypothetical protein n=1 Tax=Herbaspirillum sp. NPDC087042 TaxID=3364004 RepID=UPI003822DDC3
MTSSISGLSSNWSVPTHVGTAPARTTGIDSDGDRDNSAPGEAEKPKASTGALGTIIDTHA